MESPKEILKVAQKGIILNSPTRDKILVGRYLESKYLPDILIGKRCLLGGRIEPGEPLDKSFEREIWEEAGVTIRPGRVIDAYDWTYNKDGSLMRVVAIVRVGHYESGDILIPTQENEVKLAKAEWIPIKRINLEEFVEDEQPVLGRFLQLSRRAILRL